MLFSTSEGIEKIRKIVTNLHNDKQDLLLQVSTQHYEVEKLYKEISELIKCNGEKK